MVDFNLEARRRFNPVDGGKGNVLALAQLLGAECWAMRASTGNHLPDRRFRQLQSWPRGLTGPNASRTIYYVTIEGAMPITPPDLPAVLTKANWDKNKGILAKMAGFTGMGVELAALEAQYKKVKWNDYDMQIRFPRGDVTWTLKSLETVMENMVADVKNGECGKLRLQAFKARDVADKTAKEFKSNKLIPKSSTALCESISKAADQLGVAANPASMGGAIKATHKLVTVAFDVTAESIEKSYASHLSKLEKALLPVVKEPTYDAWLAAGIMTLARNLNQQIGNVENLAKRGYDVGMKPADCMALFKDLNLYARTSVPFEKDADEKDRKDHVRTLLGLLIRAKKLK